VLLADAGADVALGLDEIIGAASGKTTWHVTMLRRAAAHNRAASASWTWLSDHLFQEPGIGEVADEHNLAIPDAEDLDGRSAITLGIIVSRHLIKSDELATADPAQVISLLRPGLLSLAAPPAMPAAPAKGSRSAPPVGAAGPS
jgi:hypothetical protein